MHGFWKIAAGGIQISVGDPAANASRIKEVWIRAAELQVALVAFPELCLTGYSCGDLFHQQQLQSKVAEQLGVLAESSKSVKTAAVIGVPLDFNGRLFNGAVVIQGGRILGAVPKSYIPNYKEFYEKRWFNAGEGVRGETLKVAGQELPFGTDLLFSFPGGLKFGIEICEDLWTPIPPSTQHALAGAVLSVNLSASNDVIGKANYRRDLVRSQSGRCIGAYLYASAGAGESSTDLVFSGHQMIAENGKMLQDRSRFSPGSSQGGADGELLVAEIDVARLQGLRKQESSFSDFKWQPFREVLLAAAEELKQLERRIDPSPFVPAAEKDRHRRCEEIVWMLTAALAQRLAHVKSKSAVIGVSGGLDSTLALLVTHRACQQEGLACVPYGVNMPGFGSTERTQNNGRRLCELLGVETKVVDIRPACEQHFKDIGHDGQTTDVTYENVQARERTQVLMDIANQRQGLVIGTGDLSEMALGWSTYAGDQISMYALNSGVPKTLVRHLVEWFVEQGGSELGEVLSDICATPVSPELVPGDKGEIAQKTEQILGPYAVHDFFLYHFLRYGSGPDRILFLAEQAFGAEYQREQLRGWLEVFLKRFFQNQFKRSCTPDGPKVGTVSLSPRGDWRMPSDASYRAWLD